MIVPRNNLLFWVAVVILPFSLLAAVEPSAGVLCLCAIGVFFLCALADGFAARTCLEGLSVELPAIARMSKDREAKLELRIRNQRQKTTNLRLGLSLPPEIQSDHEDAWIALPAGTEWSRFHWNCRPVKRGNYQLDCAYLESASALRFWAVRRQVPLQCEIRVYPNLFTERKDLAALFLHRGSFGLHAQRQVGKGREFEQLREYVPGDGFDEVHWKATAKRGRPITKIFQVERTQEVYVVIDASRLSARPIVCSASGGGRSLSPHPGPLPRGEGESSPAPGSDAALKFRLPLPKGEGRGEGEGTALSSDLATTPTTTLERFITAALVLGLAAEQQGDLFGLLTFTDKVDHFVRAKNGKAHYNNSRDALYTLEPRIVTPDYDELCTFLRLRLRRRALLVFLTSLDDSLLAESFVRNIELIRRQHLVLVNMLQPPGATPLFTNPNIATMDELYQHLGGHLLWQKLRELEKILQRRGVRFSLLQDERLSAELVSQYLSVKKRQLL